MESSFIIPQSPLIKDAVCAFWQLHRYNSSTLHQTIVPKGAVEIIFSFETTKLYAEIGQQSFTIPRCFIQGFHTCPVHLHLADRQSFFGIFLHPTVVKHILNFHPVEFSNSVIDLTLIDPSFYGLWHYLGEHNSFEKRVSIFTEWLIKRLPALTEREQAFNTFLNAHSDLHLSVSDVAKQFCYSSKQLSRKLFELTGLNTEQTLLYKKHLQAVQLLHYSDLSLTEITYGCHFFDQSHFIRTFKALSHMTPKEYRAKKDVVSGHIIDNVH
ncbi:MAG: helix-turn-helix transcriptional regulator [Bacteroidetes bacterium]|nr:helix-turn-helix transcriptional regulator [Bacteroidota bacterium]